MSYINFLKAEDKLHHECCVYLQMQYPKLFFFHTPNEGKRSNFEQFKFKYLFARAGVPDLIIITKFPQPPIAVEFKDPQDGVLSDEQEAFLFNLRENGWSAYVITYFTQFQKMCDELLSQYKNGNQTTLKI